MTPSLQLHFVRSSDEAGMQNCDSTFMQMSSHEFLASYSVNQECTVRFFPTVHFQITAIKTNLNEKNFQVDSNSNGKNHLYDIKVDKFPGFMRFWEDGLKNTIIDSKWVLEYRLCGLNTFSNVNFILRWKRIGNWVLSHACIYY